MKNPILRIVVSAVIFSLVAGIGVAVTGLFLHWKTYTQFSDGFFWTGAILISLGFVSLLGERNQSVSGLQTSQSAVPLDAAERSRLWAADMSRGHNILVFLGTSGVLLVGMSGLAILVGRLF